MKDKMTQNYSRPKIINYSSDLAGHRVILAYNLMSNDSVCTNNTQLVYYYMGGNISTISGEISEPDFFV